VTRRLRWILGFLAALAAGCDDDSFVPSAGVAISFTGERAYMEIGDTARFGAVVKDSAGNVLSRYRPTFRSSDPTVLTIDDSGLAEARGLGKVLIIASVAGASTGWSLAVIPRIAGLRITTDSLTLLPTDRYLMAAELLAASGQTIGAGDWELTTALGREIAWSVTDTTIGTIGPEAPQQPLVTAHREGTTSVTARFRNFADSSSLSVVLLSFAEVTTGGDQTCARATTGDYYCWPHATEWYASGWVPRRVNAAGFVALTLGTAHGCGFTADGQSSCFGSNEYGQRGIGALNFPPGFTPVVGGFRFTTIAAGDYHTCGITADHEVVCWGLTRDRQAGDSTVTCAQSGKYSIQAACAPAPQVLRESLASLPFIKLAAGSSHTCGLRADSLAYCWGRLAGVRADRSLPVSTSRRFVALASSSAMACGLDAAGFAYCWGDDSDGLGDGQTDTSAAPVAVAGGIRFRSLAGLRGSVPSAAPDGGMCGVVVDGALMCWGLPEAPTPSRFAAPLLYTSVSMGASHGCGLSTDGALYCWGNAYLPALGIPESTFRSRVPHRVTGQR